MNKELRTYNSRRTRKKRSIKKRSKIYEFFHKKNFFSMEVNNYIKNGWLPFLYSNIITTVILLFSTNSVGLEKNSLLYLIILLLLFNQIIKILFFFIIPTGFIFGDILGKKIKFTFKINKLNNVINFFEDIFYYLEIKALLPLFFGATYLFTNLLFSQLEEDTVDYSSELFQLTPNLFRYILATLAVLTLLIAVIMESFKIYVAYCKQNDSEINFNFYRLIVYLIPVPTSIIVIFVIGSFLKFKTQSVEDGGVILIFGILLLYGISLRVKSMLLFFKKNIATNSNI